LKLLNAPALAALALLSAVLVVPFLPLLKKEAFPFALEVTLTAAKPGIVQVYWNDGGGLSEANSSILNVPSGGPPAVYRLQIPSGTYDSLRFDPLDNDGAVSLYSSRIIDKGGHTLCALSPTDFSPNNQIESLRVVGSRLEIETVPGGNDPQLLLKLQPRLFLHAGIGPILAEFAPRAACVFALIVVLLLLLGRSPGFRDQCSSAVKALGARPKTAVMLASGLAVVVSAYPVVFGQRSFVAPNIADIRLLYDRNPTLPGYRSPTIQDVKGSDVGAIFWEHIPFSMIEHRAVTRDVQWPVWDRYNSCGAPLLGQGQSMFGDPMHFLVIAANGAAWSWDATYLGEKWILAVGLGLLVLALAGNTAAAVIVSIAAPFFGFFIYRTNHPAFFSFCTAPWPLYFWIRVSGAPSLRSVTRWSAALILANLSLMNSGTVKEAYMLLFAMNFSGLCVLLAAREAWRVTLKRLAMVTGAMLVFVMISAPVWMSFLETLRESYTSYDSASAFQIQPGLLLGLFDEALYRPLTHGEYVFNPSANFVILAGILYFAATLRLQLRSRAVLAIAASSLFPLSMAFGLIPGSWIVRLPFLQNVAHIDNCFSCALIILWSILAGVGFSAAHERIGTEEGKWDLLNGALLLFALLFAYIGLGQAIHRTAFPAEPVFTPLTTGNVLPISMFVGGYLASLLLAVAAAAALARRRLRTGKTSVGLTAGLLLCAWVMLWRQGMLPSSAAFEDYAVHPGPRPDFHASSAAMDRMLSSQASEPSRGIGLEGTFLPGWSAAYGLEGICGPDALMNPYYRELAGASPLRRIWDWRLYLARENVESVRPFLDFLNVRYYFGMPGEQLAQSTLIPRAHEDLDTYESPTAWPRAFFSNRVAVYGTPSDLMNLILHGDGRPFAAVQENEIGAAAGIPSDLEGRISEAAKDYVLTERTTSFTVHADSPGVAVLNETYWPSDAHAKVNGKSARVIRANHAFQGVLIEQAGDYRIEFSYAPRRFGLSVAMAAIGVAMTALSLWVTRRSSGPTDAAHVSV
jgi:hypothetical protein